MGVAALYLDAARHLRARQLAGRARRLVPPAVLAAGLRPGGAPPALEPYARGLGVDPAPQSGPVAPPHETGRFAAVGVQREAGAPGFWRDGDDGLLFLFALHGFGELARYAAGARTAAGDAFWAGVVEDWLASEGAHPAMPAWHPFPTSDRLVAWSAALSAGGWPRGLQERLRAELHRQARYLRRTVEHDIGGNHVLRNATALCFAGAVLPGTRSLDQGLALLRRETARQLLADGAHEELSPSYHRHVAHDLVEVAELVRRVRGTAPGWLADAAARAAAWQAALVGPDGRLPLLGDAWEGPPADGAGAAPEVPEPGPSGHVVLRHGADVLVFDAGPVGPAHLPAHTHADALGLVLWADGAPLVADPGAFAYTGPERRAFRATAAHATVEVDGADQCVLWGDFRAAHLPVVRRSPARREQGAVVVAAGHDGYRRLADPVVHHRTVVWLPGEGVVVVDRLAARRAHAIVSRLPLAPGVDPGAPPLAIAAQGEDGPAAPRPAQAWHAPYLGTRVPATVLEDARTVAPGEPFGWSLLRGDRRVAQLRGDRLVLEGPRAEIALEPLPPSP